MLISEALGGTRPLDVHFDGGAVLKIVYRPSSYTVADLQALEASARKDVSRVIQSVLDIVESWDLERWASDEERAEGAAPRVPVALEVEEIRVHVPTRFLTRIIRAVNEDQSAGE